MFRSSGAPWTITTFQPVLLLSVGVQTKVQARAGTMQHKDVLVCFMGCDLKFFSTKVFVDYLPIIFMTF